MDMCEARLNSYYRLTKLHY